MKSRTEQMNLEFLIEESNTHVNDLEFEDFDTIMSRKSLESYSIKSNLGRTNFTTTSSTIGADMGEFVNVIAPRSITVPEFQRDLRDVKGDDVKEFHKNVFVYGQTNLVPVIVTPIERVLNSVERELESLPVGTKENLEELLVDRKERYTKLLEDGYGLFNIDGQTRMMVWQKYYSLDSTEPIVYDTSSSDPVWEKKNTGTGRHSVISPFNGVIFSQLDPEVQQIIYANTRVNVMLVETDSHTIPATTFSIANSGVPQRPTLTDMNSSPALGLRNQIEKLNLRKDSPEYAIHISMGYQDYDERFYAQTCAMFDKEARGIDAFEMMRSVYLFGHRMGADVEIYKGNLLFDEHSPKGWQGVKKTILAMLDFEWDAKTEKDMIETKNARSLAIKNLDQKSRQLKYSSSVKVNSVLFEGILFDRAIKLTDLSYLAYVDFFEWDRTEREESMYLKYTEQNVRDSKVLTVADIGKESRFNGRRQKDSNGYWKWGQKQNNAKWIEERKRHIEKYVDENIDLWLAKGWLA